MNTPARHRALSGGGKHIEGPWDIYIGEERDVIAVSKWIDGPNGGKMAISLAKMPMPSKNLTQEQINGNGRLMKAAPDLLVACKAQHNAIDILLARLSQLDDQFMPSKSGIPWEAMLAGNAAIAKAEGREP